MKQKILSLLVLLLTAATGAWAADTYTITFSGFGNEACNKTVTDATLEYSETFNVTDVYANYTILGGVGGSNDYVSISKSQDETQITITVKSAFEGTINVTVYYMNENFDDTQREISVTCVKSAPAIEVVWDAKTKSGKFSMPGSDVILTPVYAPAAKWAVESEKEQLPTAAEGVIAGTTEPIIVEGTVASIGETENLQGTVMYAVTTTNTTAPALTAFSATVPTGAVLSGTYDTEQTVYVWYYIKGADAPQGEEATAENTFNDTEICAEPLAVILQPNVFTLYLLPTRLSEITVEMNGNEVTPTENKVTNVPMDAEMELKAKEGYKFRKVEVKNGEAGSGTIAGVVTSDIGKVVCTDGTIYATKAEALEAGAIPVAMIAYVGSETGNDTYKHGLAIALTDESPVMNYSTAQTAATNKTPLITGASAWMIPSQAQWWSMLEGTNGDKSDGRGLQAALNAAGGATLVHYEDNAIYLSYWTSTQRDATHNFLVRCYDNDTFYTTTVYSQLTTERTVRLCVAF